MVKFTEVMVDILDSACSYSQSALSKMTRRKNSPQKKELETVLSAKGLQNLDFNTMSETQFRNTIIKLLVALEKWIKDSRDIVTAELRSKQTEIKNRFNKMQSKLDVLTAKVNEVEDRVSDIEDKLMVRKEAEEKREKLTAHEERLREINDSLRRKNIQLLGSQKSQRERERREDQKVYVKKS